ncbi:MAG: ATP-binding protein [Spirochaetes bacterium]|nr:ATP-binding protein [Spirochaetota bacterium]
MKKIKRLLSAVLAVFLIFILLPACGKPAEQPGVMLTWTSFMDIPGVTEEEIKTIEALRAQRTYFIYGMISSTESFYNVYGGISGFSALVCDWLTELFGIPFVLRNFTLEDLTSGLASHEIDFTGYFMLTEWRRDIYYMTSPIISRQVKYFRLTDTLPLPEIRQTRKPRYILIADSAATYLVLNNAQYEFEPVYIINYLDAYDILKRGDADALVTIGNLETGFETYGDVVTSDFFPLIFTSGSFSTQNPQLAPFVSVVQKALDNGANSHLNELYRQGIQEYTRHRLLLRLSEEEFDFINSGPIIPFVANTDNYPVNFFNTRENEFQGIFFDMLREVRNLTGLEFLHINDRSAQFPQLLQMLEDGEALILSEVIRTPDREGRFLWPNTAYMANRPALISRTDNPFISFSEVYSVKVGLSKGTGYTELFHRWFPNHGNIIEYESQGESFDALIRGEVDMVMNAYRSLSFLTHYQERPYFKANIVFDYNFYSAPGFNKDAVLLHSIFEKAMELIDIETISRQWLHRTFDYRTRLLEAQMQAQRPWIIGTSALILIIFVIMTILSVTYIQRKNTIAGQVYANKLSSTLAKITKSSAITAGALKDAAELITQEGCCVLGTSRVEVWGVSEDKKNLEYLSCFSIPEGGHAERPDFELPDYEEYVKLLKSERLISTNYISMSDIFFNSRNAFSANTIAGLDAPIWIDGELAGLICIEQEPCGKFPKAREWTSEEQNFASSLADLMALVISGNERRIARDDAEAANRAKTSFLANMSHELRTPLNVIIGLTNLSLEEKELTRSVLENLQKINNAGSTLLGIVNDILDFSKIETGKLTLTPSKYHLSTLLNDVVTMVVMRLDEKPVVFRLNISDNLPNNLFGDDLRVKQIFNNLLSNALKYTHAGKIELTVDCIKDGEKAVWMEIAVSDTGTGIREEDMKKIFFDYYQAETKINRKVPGTGLGLPITKKLAELMDGEITAESEYGKGTLFRVRIRQLLAGNTTIGYDAAESLRKFQYAEDTRAVANKQLVRPDLSFARVLVVDDMQTNLDVAAGLLRKYKMQIDCVLSGQEAIELIRRGEPVYNAIFMDHMMPVMNGIEAADAIRSLDTEYAQKIPIIALTANAIHGTADIFFAHGFQAFISKPVNIMRLDSVIRKWICRELPKESLDTGASSEKEEPV